ncbi:MAG: hypothetical protein R8G66_06000 [Cytophagales bacterium]|nr:hypothetical protein [Cytophagales bacterium]
MDSDKETLWNFIFNFLINHIWTYRSFLLIIIIGAMVNNLEHSADLYMKISTKVTELQAYAVVIIFDLIVIALIAVGDSKAFLFAISIFLINELAWDGVNIFYQIVRKASDIEYSIDEPTKVYLTLIERGVTMLIYGSTFAFTVHHFSLLFKQQISKHTKLNRLLADLRNRLAEASATSDDLSRRQAESLEALAELAKKNDEYQQNEKEKLQQLENLRQQVKNLSAKNEELNNYRLAIEQELTCICGQRFDTLSQKFGHQRKCKDHKIAKDST